ncbi:MAG: hypothetical protein ACK4TC_06930 [Sphingomonas pseudosanguinis]|uniref:hypothetical protein n=1 Tax=Sphingomonas pseudosanguinis TaxID=413712 RepID=UPI00391D9EBB
MNGRFGDIDPGAGRDQAGADRLAVLGAAIFQILTPILPLLGIGRPIGDQSTSVQTLITPAGWAFSIWSFLYAGSLAYAVYQALPAQRDNRLLAGLRWPSVGAFLGNGLWALYTQLDELTFLSVLIIATTLTCLVSVYRQLVDAPQLTRGERWFVALPLSALTAWLTAATIVNIAASLNYHGFAPEMDRTILAGAVILTGGVIASAVIRRGAGNPWYALVFLWALAGINARSGQFAVIAASCAIAALAVIVTTVFGLRQPYARAHWFGTTPGREGY